MSVSSATKVHAKGCHEGGGSVGGAAKGCQEGRGSGGGQLRGVRAGAGGGHSGGVSTNVG